MSLDTQCPSGTTNGKKLGISVDFVIFQYVFSKYIWIANIISKLEVTANTKMPEEYFSSKQTVSTALLSIYLKCWNVYVAIELTFFQGEIRRQLWKILKALFQRIYRFHYIYNTSSQFHPVGFSEYHSKPINGNF